MFSSLSKGSVLYGVDRKGDMNWFTGSVERVSPSVNQNFQPSFNQFPTVAIDIVANINGEQKANIKAIMAKSILNHTFSSPSINITNI